MSKKNSEGYMDITANEALDAVEREEREVRKLIQTIQNICSLSGYKMNSRIEIENKASGHIYR